MANLDQLDEVLSETSLSDILAIYSSLDGYTSVPVGIDTFIEDPYYLGNIFGSVWEDGPNKGHPKVFPYWREQLRDIYPNPFFSPYSEVNITGCLTADTMIDTLDGESVPIKYLAIKSNWKNPFWILAYDTQTNEYIPAQATAGFTGLKKIVEVTLDNGEIIEASYEHRFLSSDNKVILAKNLKVGDSLKSYNKRNEDNYPEIWSHSDKCWKPIHRIVGEWKSDCKEKDVHHNYKELNVIWDDIIELAKNYNHKVVNVRLTEKIEPVYCLKVPKYETFCLSNGIVVFNCLGSGKTLCCLLGILYDFYRLLLIKDPHEKYGLISTTIISFALFTLTKETGSIVLQAQITDIFATSPFFKARLSPVPNSNILFPNKIGLVMGSTFHHGLGQAIISGFLDEANFQKECSNQAGNTYNNTKRRIISRFMGNEGKVPCRFWIASSKKDDSSFLEKLIESNRNDPHVKIIETRIWEVMWFKGNYCGVFFRVFAGDNNKDPFVIDKVNLNENDIKSSEVIRSDESIEFIDESRIIPVPIEYYTFFERDVNGSLRDFAGVSTTSIYRIYKSMEKILPAFLIPHAFNKDVIQLGEYDDSAIHLYMNDYLKLIQNKTQPRCFHMDLALTGDKVGMAMTHAHGQKVVKRHNLQTGEVQLYEEIITFTDFAIGIECIAGQEIPYFKLREFLIYLRNSLGFNIVMVSTDGYMSSEMRQNCRQQGFETDLLSVDRTKDPHLGLKRSLLEGTTFLPNSEQLKFEMKYLEDTGKMIDHPEGTDPETKKRYGKDVLDAVAGSRCKTIELAHSSLLYANDTIKDMEIFMNKKSMFKGMKNLQY